MPELPEVETVMRGLMPVLQGQRILRAEQTRPDLRWPLPARLPERLGGARVLGFQRRAKYILAQLDTDETLLIHLGMSGRMVLRAPGSNEAPPKHEHVTLYTEAGWQIGFVDPRRFGALDLFPSADVVAHKLLAQLGPEPLGDDFTPAYLSSALAGKRGPIKTVLLDQHVVAGLGNIYVCEALHLAGISPLRAADTVRTEKLVPAIRDTLKAAIAAGGSTLRDYARPDGELGYFQHAWRVYGREGEACPACAGRTCRIKRVVQAGRSTFYCTRTQR